MLKTTIAAFAIIFAAGTAQALPAAAIPALDSLERSGDIVLVKNTSNTAKPNVSGSFSGRTPPDDSRKQNKR